MPILYQYALSLGGSLVSVSELDKSNLGYNGFVCLSCGRDMVAKLGQKKEKHFAHKEEVVCSGETYLHQLGKKVFEETFRDCQATKKPFQLYYKEYRHCNHYQGQCNTKYHVFLVNANGKALLMEWTPTELNAHLRRYSPLFHRILPFREWNAGERYRNQIAQAHMQGIPVRSCYLCKYHGENRNLNSDAPIFCKHRKQPFVTTEAVTCAAYRVGREYVEECLSMQ